MKCLHIRQAVQGDAQVLANLATQLGYPSTKEETVKRLDVLLTSSDHEVLVAQDPNDAIIGWAHVNQVHRLESDDFAELCGLIVDESRRGEGAGEALVEESTQWAVSRGLKVLRVRTRSERIGAHRFYERLGFKKSKEQWVYDMDPRS